MDDELVKVNISWTVDDTNPDVRALISVLERERKQAAARIEADARRIAELEGLVKEAREKANALIDIVEGIKGTMEHGTWRAERSNLRMKDTDEWAAFYVLFRARMGGSDGSA
jgi:hypothetical protein